MGVKGEPCGRGQVWGEGGIGQDRLGYAAVTTPRSQWLETIQVISCSHCIYVPQCSSSGGSVSPDSVTQVHKADTIAQVLVDVAEGQRAPDCAVQ